MNTLLKKKPLAIVLSNETRGLNPSLKGEKISIQISNDIESLNVAQAASILFYELAKPSRLRDNSR